MKRILSILMMSLAIVTMTMSEAIPHHHHGDTVCYDIGHCLHEHNGHSHEAGLHHDHSCGADRVCEHKAVHNDSDCEQDTASHDSDCEHCGNKSCSAHIDIFVVPAAENKSIICDGCSNDCGHDDLLLFVNVIYALVCPPPVALDQPVRPDLTVPLPADFINSPFGLRAPPLA